MTYKSPLVIDQFASDVEDFLTKSSAIPLVGSVPALLKSSFGIAQIMAASATLIFSIPYSFFYSSVGLKMMLHASRHFVHGIANIISGLVLAIPFVGTFLAAPELCYALLGKGYYPSVDYKNNQSHKFFAYKSIQDTTWHDHDNKVSPEEVPVEKDSPWVLKASFSL